MGIALGIARMMPAGGEVGQGSEHTCASRGHDDLQARGRANEAEVATALQQLFQRGGGPGRLHVQQLEQHMLSGNPNDISTIGSTYQNVFAPLPATTAVPENIEYQIDMGDAQAQDALKKAIELDAFAARELEVAQKLNGQIAASAAGSAPILDAEASAWVVQGNAYTQMGMAELLRLNSAGLSNRSGELKDSTNQMQNLNQQLQQTLTVLH